MICVDVRSFEKCFHLGYGVELWPFVVCVVHFVFPPHRNKPLKLHTRDMMGHFTFDLSPGRVDGGGAG